ncbi:hypothetical protein B0H13DRAFT_2675410 [Mycena leptocephala]|nr:hypothetical protein B0H13DRAFT_2675410 [Mycena leptocephala]
MSPHSVTFKLPSSCRILFHPRIVSFKRRNPMAFPISPEAQIALLQQYENSRIINAGMASSLTWVAYDFLLTFSREYKYIWRAKMSFPKILYLFLRFYVMAFIAANLYIRSRPGYSNKVCKGYHWWEIMGVPVITNITANALLSIRLNALYGRSRKVLGLLSFLFVGSLCAELYICVQYAINSTKGPGTVLPPPIPGCIPTSIPIGFPAIIAWIPTVVVQAIFLGMAVLHLFHSAAVDPAATGAPLWKMLWETKHATPLIVWFVRDGAFFFLVILISLVVGLVIMVHLTALTSLAICFIMAAYSFAGGRMILNLRENAAKALSSSPSWKETFELQTSIMFATNAGREGDDDRDGSTDSES